MKDLFDLSSVVLLARLVFLRVDFLFFFSTLVEEPVADGESLIRGNKEIPHMEQHIWKLNLREFL